ncbi:hypothetical protein [Streptomyces avicenniae]|uniref:hypothetical protein n=1 Tax=Streptomyces avicenniae TaxID=500153 RepID=UPI00069A5035|nr:hypothetical protein [Streptomyces avicenniae]
MAETRRGAARRTGDSAFGALLLARNLLLLLVAALLVAGGVRESWDLAPHAMFPGDREQGDMLLTACDRDACTGTFSPGGRTVVLEQTVGREAGETLPVVLKPDSTLAVRSDAAGILLAWLPLTGALLLAAIVVGGGLRWARTAWSLALLSLTALGVTFALGM